MNIDFIALKFYKALTKIILIGKEVQIQKSTFLYGLPIWEIFKNSKCYLGENFSIISSTRNSMLGINRRSKIRVESNAVLRIGNNFAGSNITIICKESITIGSNILFGGGVIVVDSDFHSLRPSDWNTKKDYENIKNHKVIIGDNVFIGMNSVILKGVTIGNNVIIGACSVVSKNIPNGQIWGGNPAKFIKIIKY